MSKIIKNWTSNLYSIGAQGPNVQLLQVPRGGQRTNNQNAEPNCNAIGPFLLLPKLQTDNLSSRPSPATKPCKSTDERCKPRHAEHKTDIDNPQNCFIILEHNQAENNLSSAKLPEEVESLTILLQRGHAGAR
jgi:hypothetical protein